MQLSRILPLSRAKIVKALTFTFCAITLTFFSCGAFASGGTASAGGGGSGGGGGVTPSPTPASRAGSFTSFKVVAGYRPGGAFAAAIWTSFSVQTLYNATPYMRLTIVDASTGEVHWNAIYQLFGATIDDDYLPFNRTFNVKGELFDANGNLLDSRLVVTTTPLPKDGITGP